ncbi:hypothetical protein ACPA54_05455 [Uniformispora flossi]|uniref:hypothetical protein n=1 Tax=Uniformispora flossi TaxID=3390723 RepID=UPI003C2ECB32
MRRVRTLVAGTALGFAALTMAVPAAYADAGPSAADSGKSWSSGEEHKSGGMEKDSGEQKGRPHGGPHAGVGILDDGAGLATGAVLIAGGLGLGAYALRRRTSSGTAAA